MKNFIMSKLCSLKACNFTKHELLHMYLSRIFTVNFSRKVFKKALFSVLKKKVLTEDTHKLVAVIFIELYKIFFQEGRAEIKIV